MCVTIGVFSGIAISTSNSPFWSVIIAILASAYFVVYSVLVVGSFLFTEFISFLICSSLIA